MCKRVAGVVFFESERCGFSRGRLDRFISVDRFSFLLFISFFFGSLCRFFFRARRVERNRSARRFINGQKVLRRRHLTHKPAEKSNKSKTKKKDALSSTSRCTPEPTNRSSGRRRGRGRRRCCYCCGCNCCCCCCCCCRCCCCCESIRLGSVDVLASAE